MAAEAQCLVLDPNFLSTDSDSLFHGCDSLFVFHFASLTYGRCASLHDRMERECGDNPTTIHSGVVDEPEDDSVTTDSLRTSVADVRSSDIVAFVYVLCQCRCE